MVRIIYSSAPYEGNIRFPVNLINYLKKNKVNSVALFASVQFLKLDVVKKQLNEARIKINITKAKRADKEIQILGCDIYPDSFNEPIIEKSDIIIYVGDGEFHANAALFAGAKSILVYNPISDSYKIITRKDIEKKLNKIKINLRKFINSENIGIIVSLKPGQQYFVLAEKLKMKLKKQGKNVFIFIDDNFNLSNIENFNFIDSWVNSACPRIGTDDIINSPKPIVNIKDAFEPAEYLDKTF